VPPFHETAEETGVVGGAGAGTGFVLFLIILSCLIIQRNNDYDFLTYFICYKVLFLFLWVRSMMWVPGDTSTYFSKP